MLAPVRAVKVGVTALKVRVSCTRVVVGTGTDAGAQADRARAASRLADTERFMVLLGRGRAGLGCDELP
ncbi:hypothetical protein GCM10010844_38940 [Deinococcus radiotolerans]|uniref:Uncharacterized protein n=1 Tax=Deinococcus radiotolerans TaxID=1309407 RepID=A0ABQ2FQD5_9DEIO|nr:hypothetical protein GCM10010844_38940 [Deinococcus radiotolerans]